MVVQTAATAAVEGTKTIAAAAVERAAGTAAADGEGAHRSGGCENRSIVGCRSPEGRIRLRSQAGGLAKRPYVTRVAKPEAVMAATFGVYGKTLTQIALGIHETTTLQN